MTNTPTRPSIVGAATVEVGDVLLLTKNTGIQHWREAVVANVERMHLPFYGSLIAEVTFAEGDTLNIFTGDQYQRVF